MVIGYFFLFKELVMRLNQNEINWIANEFKANRTIEEIAIDTGMSKQNVKRALAEASILDLSWYKTKNEQAMIAYLKAIGIHTLNQLREAL